VPPTIVKELEDVSVTEGSECAFTVNVEGFPNPTAEWYKNDAKLKPDKRFTTRFEDNTFYLTITDAKMADQGKFKTLIKNKAGQVESRQANLNVTGKTSFLNILNHIPNQFVMLFYIVIQVGPKILKPLKDVEVVEGKPLELICEASATPMPSAEWFRDDLSISHEDPRLKITSNGSQFSLLIEQTVEETDNALYRVKFANDFGSSESKANVTVLSKQL
jgi:hypothetical protein